MSDLIMYAYKNASEGATLVANALEILKMNHENSTWVARKGRTVLNWGSGQLPDRVFRARVLNHPDAVMDVIDKGRFFRKIEASKSQKKPRVPAFTFGQVEAKKWLVDGQTVLARTELQGARGEGIVVMKKPIDFTYAPLYTTYIDKDAEFRIHVIDGKVVARQQKIRDPERTPSAWEVRNWDNGFILVNRVSPVPTDTDVQAIAAVKFFEMDFGAVDVIVKDDVAYVLEINSAPWMNEALAKKYATAFQELLAA